MPQLVNIVFLVLSSLERLPEIKEKKSEILDNYSKLDSRAYLIHSTAENYVIVFALNDFIFSMARVSLSPLFIPPRIVFETE